MMDSTMRAERAMRHALPREPARHVGMEACVLSLRPVMTGSETDAVAVTLIAMVQEVLRCVAMVRSVLNSNCATMDSPMTVGAAMPPVRPADPVRPAVMDYCVPNSKFAMMATPTLVVPAMLSASHQELGPHVATVSSVRNLRFVRTAIQSKTMDVHHSAPRRSAEMDCSTNGFSQPRP